MTFNILYSPVRLSENLRCQILLRPQPALPRPRPAIFGPPVSSQHRLQQVWGPDRHIETNHIMKTVLVVSKTHSQNLLCCRILPDHTTIRFDRSSRTVACSNPWGLRTVPHRNVHSIKSCGADVRVMNSATTSR